jgi:hypothetical protein
MRYCVGGISVANIRKAFFVFRLRYSFPPIIKGNDYNCDQ